MDLKVSNFGSSASRIVRIGFPQVQESRHEIVH